MKMKSVYSLFRPLLIVLMLAFGVGIDYRALAADFFTDDSQIRLLNIEEATKICKRLKPNEVTREQYDVIGVVGGTCNSRQDRLMLNVDLWQGETLFFAYRLSSFDSTAFAHRFDLEWGDTIVIRGRLENYKERPCSYYGYIVGVRKYINPANELIKANLDREWKIYAQARSNDAHARMLWVSLGLVIAAMIALTYWLYKVHYHLTHDALTHLRNRKGGEFRIKNKMRFGRTGYLCLLDINGFKHVNDRFGHRTGDLCLKDFATLIRNEFPDCLAMRLDGNEFAVFIENVSRETLNLMMEEFFGSVQNFTIPNDPDFRITVSVGTAFYDGEGDYAQLFHRADQCLYKSKFHKGNWLT